MFYKSIDLKLEIGRRTQARNFAQQWNTRHINHWPNRETAASGIFVDIGCRVNWRRHCRVGTEFVRAAIHTGYLRIQIDAAACVSAHWHSSAKLSKTSAKKVSCCQAYGIERTWIALLNGGLASCLVGE